MSLNVGRLMRAVQAYDACKAFRQLLERREEELEHALAALQAEDRAEYERHVAGKVDIEALLTNGTFRRRGE